jgi:hypothetical protein
MPSITTSNKIIYIPSQRSEGSLQEGSKMPSVAERTSLNIRLLRLSGKLSLEFDDAIFDEIAIFHCSNCSLECIDGSSALKTPNLLGLCNLNN